MAAHRPASAERMARELAASGAAASLAPELAGWLAGSSRFTAFAEANRAKIRKKLRGAADDASVLDIRAELAVARHLIADRRFELAFEPFGRGGGPDFLLTHPSGRACTIEVTRLRRPPDEAAISGVVLGKLRQLPPSVPNLLLVACERVGTEEADIGAAMRALRSRADHRDDAWFAFRGIEGARAFYERYLRLGGVILWTETELDGERRATPWANGSARIPVPDPTMRAVLACLRV